MEGPGSFIGKHGRYRKGQMFIVTIVFLVGVVFVVQQILLQYSYVDMPSAYQGGDFHILRSAETIATRAVTVASTCFEAERNLEESILFLRDQVAGGYSLNVDYSVNCTNWGNMYPDPGPVSALIKVTSENSESTNNMVIYSTGAYPCACSNWRNQGCGPSFGCNTNLDVRKTRTCTPAYCGQESACITDILTCTSITCRIAPPSDSCTAGEVDVLHMSSLMNAHAELPSSSIYDYKVCCMGTNLDNDCSAGDAAPFLTLSSPTNAHVEETTVGIYTNDVCLSGNSITCGYASAPQTCTDLNGNAECIVSMSGNTNAHVANCTGVGSYNNKACCWIS
jgi:hypothetical protein